LSVDVLNAGKGPVAARLEAWRSGRATAIERTAKSVAALTEGEMTISRLSVAAGLLADLAQSA
jgi:glutamate dehydrogenase